MTQQPLLSTPPTVQPRSRQGVRVPAVTVIIPTYNRADLLGETLDSVAAQTFTDYDTIVVDDGSDDHTRELIQQRPEPIRYLYQNNQGVSEARNRALRVVHSEFVAFLDSDDLWQSTFLEATVARLRKNPHEVLVYSDFVSIDANGQPRRGHRKRPRGGEVTAPLFASTFIHTSAVVVRSQIIRDAGGFDGRLTHNEDYDLWLRLSLRHRFGLVDHPLCMRRCHADSLSRRDCTPEILLRKAELLEHFYENGAHACIAPSLARRRISRLYYTAAKAYLRDGQPETACRLLRFAIDRNPRNARACFWLLRAAIERQLQR